MDWNSFNSEGYSGCALSACSQFMFSEIGDDRGSLSVMHVGCRRAWITCDWKILCPVVFY